MPASPKPAGQRLLALEQDIKDIASELAVLLVFDRPKRINERPALARQFFAERCLSDEQLEELLSAFRSINAYVELFEGERELLDALTGGRLDDLARPYKIIYNGI